jgi:hypothetical protein
MKHCGCFTPWTIDRAKEPAETARLARRAAQLGPDDAVALSQAELSVEALRLRVRQQEILADFGVLALKGTPFSELLDHAARSVAEGLKAEFGKVLKYMPEANRFLVCAGVGWSPEVVGHATIGADMASPAGYALRTGKPVISNHLEIEERFRTPELLVEHSIRRAMNVILQGDGTPYGVLEVDSRSEGEFAQSDIVFLQGVANILGMGDRTAAYGRKSPPSARSATTPDQGGQ